MHLWIFFSADSRWGQGHNLSQGIGMKIKCSKSLFLDTDSSSNWTPMAAAWKRKKKIISSLALRKSTAMPIWHHNMWQTSNITELGRSTIGPHKKRWPSLKVTASFEWFIAAGIWFIEMAWWWKTYNIFTLGKGTELYESQFHWQKYRYFSVDAKEMQSVIFRGAPPSPYFQKSTHYLQWDSSPGK